MNLKIANMLLEEDPIFTESENFAAYDQETIGKYAELFYDGEDYTIVEDDNGVSGRLYTNGQLEED